MNVEHLVHMANQIGQFYASLPDHAEAVTSTASHIRRFWEPRMRSSVYAHLDQADGAGLSPLLLEALRSKRSDVEPKAAASR
ncbi:MAG: formate dehydrogenase subunit delta [Gemmatimonadales bacterium]